MLLHPYTKWWFKLLCCPPCLFLRPSKFAERLSFFPPCPTYDLTPVEGNNYKLTLPKRLGWYRNEWLEEIGNQMECRFGRTSRGCYIVCLYIRCCKNAKYTLLYSHGNGSDVGEMALPLYHLGREIGCNVFVYDYSGYGRSTGKPSELNLYADIKCALKVLNRDYKISNSRIILLGQSIGSVPTVDMASRKKVAGVVLVSPIASGIRTIFPFVQKSWCFDVFLNIDKVDKIRSPVLVVHGIQDELVDISQGEQLYERCPYKVDPLWLENAGHNDVQFDHKYFERLKKFVLHDLSEMKHGRTTLNTFNNSSSPRRSLSDSVINFKNKHY